MLSLRKVNPMARAVGMVGVTAGLVGAVTFAVLTSNAVAVGPNDVSTDTAHLEIATSDGSVCGTFGDGPVAGFGTFEHLATDRSPNPIHFCLRNTGTVSLKITSTLSANVSSASASGFINLNVNCNALGNKTDNLNSWFAGVTFNSFNPGNTDQCAASMSLSNTYNGAGSTVPTFSIQFKGTEVPAPTPPPTT